MTKNIFSTSYNLKIVERHLAKTHTAHSIEISKLTDISILILALVPLQSLFCQVSLFRMYNISKLSKILSP